MPFKILHLIWLISDLLIHIMCKLWILAWWHINDLDINLNKSAIWSRDVVKMSELRLISTEIARHIIADIIHSVADYHLICVVNVFKYSAISISRSHFSHGTHNGQSIAGQSGRGMVYLLRMQSLNYVSLVIGEVYAMLYYIEPRYIESRLQHNGIFFLLTSCLSIYPTKHRAVTIYVKTRVDTK